MHALRITVARGSRRLQSQSRTMLSAHQHTTNKPTARFAAPLVSAWSPCREFSSSPPNGLSPPKQDDAANKSYFHGRGFAFDFVLRMFGFYGEESTRIRNAQAIFRNVEHQATKPIFFHVLGIENNFQYNQQLIMLHVWMVHKRLLQEGKKGKLLQEMLFDTLWENTTRRIRSAGVHELTVNKHLGDVQKWSFGACVAYDHGFSVLNDEDLELGSALWRNLFASKSSADEVKVYAMAAYVRQEMQRLESVPRDELFKGQFAWGSPPTTGLSPKQVAQLCVDQNAKGKWRKGLAVDGRTYWWNVDTRESQWEEPSDEECGVVGANHANGVDDGAPKLNILKSDEK